MAARKPITRRSLLTMIAAAGAVGAVGVTSGCGVGGVGGDGPDWAPRERATCVPARDLERLTTIAGLPLVYEISQRRSSFRIESGFAAQLTRWAERLDPDGLDVDQLWTYGTWIDGGGSCDSWHNAGRAFDLSRLRLAGGAGFVSCRFDQWGNDSGSALDRARRNYWAVAAGLHRDFAYVLTYLYDATHHNHIHVDNGRSGSSAPTFSPRSGVQVQAVQAICRYLWSEPVELSGQWDGDTRAAVGRVLDQLQAPSDLSDPTAWAALMSASAARFAG